MSQKNLIRKKKRLNYEIDTFLQNNVRFTSGSPLSSLPILNRYQMHRSIDKAFLTKQAVADAIKKIMDIDSTVFYREVLWNNEKLGISREFLQKEVFPYFLMIPSIGNRVMMWQEISGNDKSSKGRIVLPTFCTANLSILLCQALATFRWELAKTCMGVDWNNIGIPSITADYTDYVQFYKKNRDLSQAIKVKLKSQFKKFRSDRERFANDYVSWIQQESNGILRLNKVVRGILYRHIPFKKDIREKLSKLPVFSEIDNRFKNIRQKKLNQLGIRYRKFGEALPEELRMNLNYYKE